MKNIYLAFLLLFGTASVLSGQSRLFGERSAFTQYHLTPFLLHPGATGQNDYSQVVGVYRNAWASFPGSPKTFAFGFDGAIGNRIGIGVIGMSDSYAAFGTTKGVLNLSYTIESPKNKLGFGISGEYVQNRLNTDGVTGVDFTDPEIVERLDGYSFFDVSLGIYGLYDGKIIYGLTVPSAISQKLSGDGDSQGREIGYIASLGYRMAIPDKDIVFEPSIYAKKLLYVPFHVDINLKADFLNEQLTAGLSGSVGGENRLGFLVGTQVSNFGFHYSYNLSLNEFQTYNNGSHELTMKLRLQPYKSKTSGE